MPRCGTHIGGYAIALSLREAATSRRRSPTQFPGLGEGEIFGRYGGFISNAGQEHVISTKLEMGRRYLLQASLRFTLSDDVTLALWIDNLEDCGGNAKYCTGILYALQLEPYGMNNSMTWQWQLFTTPVLLEHGGGMICIADRWNNYIMHAYCVGVVIVFFSDEKIAHCDY